MPELDERGNNPTATESRRSNCRFLHRQQPRIVEKGPGICVGEIRKRLGPDTDLTVASMLWIGSCFLREIRSYYVCLLFEYKLMVTISKQKNFLGDTFACLKLHVTRPKPPNLKNHCPMMHALIIGKASNCSFAGWSRQ